MIQKIYKNDVELLDSFNELTRKTFWFDFVEWHKAGYFGDMYMPHVIMDNGKVISNVSVNQMQFDVGGTIKNYLQLGTVMTEDSYRSHGLNRQIMEFILQEYKDKVDGIYLFGNDSVLEYYPKFGFEPAKEYEYYIPFKKGENTDSYQLEKVDMSDTKQADKVYALLEENTQNAEVVNENDGLYMSENISLYHFWMDSEYRDSIYYLPEKNVFVVAGVEDDKLMIYQVIGKEKIDIKKVAGAFEEEFSEVVLGYTPIHKEEFQVREHKEEDCTLFILGEDLKCVEENKMMFPILSHA